MPLFAKPLVNINAKAKGKRGNETELIAMLDAFMEFFDNGFVPAYKDLSETEKDNLREMFNGLLDDQPTLGDIMAECDKDALTDKFTDLTMDDK